RTIRGISARGPDLSVAGAVCPGRTGLGAGPGLVLTARVPCADPGLPRPAISLRPSSVPAPGANVTFRCEGPHRDVRFFLHKAGDLNPQEHVDPAGDWAEFRIPGVGRQHGGRYNCSYRPRSQPFVSSEPSDPVELLVAGEGPNSASRLPAPHVTGGGPSTLQCSLNTQGETEAHNWHPENIPNASPLRNLCLGPGSARGWGCPRRTGLGDGLGLALTACLCTDPGLPRPSISLRPTWVTAPGANITIRCQGLHWDMRFFLHKAGDLNPQEHKGPAGDGTEFHIPNMGRQHGGRYSCSFRPQSELFISSEPSDPVELVVAGEGEGPYPKPSISVSPAGVIPVGGNVTIRCWQHHYPGLRIQLYRDGIWNYLNYMDPAGSEAEFPIPSVSREHGGSYQCRYSDISGTYSEPSDPVEIIVAGEPGPASPPPAPPPARPQGVSTSPHQPMGCPASECGGGASLLGAWTPGRPCPVSAPPRWAGRGGCPRVCLRPVSVPLPGSATPNLDPPGSGVKPDSGLGALGCWRESLPGARICPWLGLSVWGGRGWVPARVWFSPPMSCAQIPAYPDPPSLCAPHRYLRRGQTSPSGVRGRAGP
uniref:Ig-like domain-containing protein n=1 Tax=Pelusios castaneus TaxID=367368 RepID=A0A8C8SG20_9SAUR